MSASKHCPGRIETSGTWKCQQCFNFRQHTWNRPAAFTFGSIDTVVYHTSQNQSNQKHSIYHVQALITSHRAINIPAAFLISAVAFQASSSAPSLPSFSSLTNTSSLSSASTSALALAFPFPEPPFFFLGVLDGVPSAASSSSPSSVAGSVSKSSSHEHIRQTNQTCACERFQE